MSLAEFKVQFDPVFAARMREEMEVLSALTEDAAWRPWFGQVSALAEAGGKRVRPYAATVLYRAFGGASTELWWRFVSGLECFHLFALIHDDIIDHAAVRHGEATLQVLGTRLLEQEGREGDLPTVAQGQTMLIGDLVHAAANRMLGEGVPDMDPACHVRAMAEYAQMVREVIVGEMVDVESVTRAAVSRGLIRTKMRLKTASYTFVRPMRIGACMAGAPEAVLEACTAFGIAVGLAFQIQDDYLDLSQPARELGKQPFTDLRERQHTQFTQHVWEHGSPAAQQQLRGWLGRSLTEADGPAVQALFQETGAFEAGLREMNSLFDEAEAVIPRFGMGASAEEELRGLVALLRKRTK
jgi:geranylgeranyl diphosphate synthase type I